MLPQAYDKLCGKLKELSALQGISGLLGWDEMWVGCGSAEWLAAVGSCSLAGWQHSWLAPLLAT